MADHSSQRDSIYDPATIRDIPPEVLGETLYYFVVRRGKRDLVTASLVCRAWYPVAQRLIVSKKVFDENRGFEKSACGLQIREIVGADILAIRYLLLDLCNKKIGDSNVDCSSCFPFPIRLPFLFIYMAFLPRVRSRFWIPSSVDVPGSETFSSRYAFDVKWSCFDAPKYQGWIRSFTATRFI